MSSASTPVAVVTGSSSGIGRAIAAEFAGAGFDVVVHARHSASQGEETVRQVHSTGRQSILVAQDLALHDSLPQFVESAWNWQGRIDAWVNNAGVDVLTGNAARWPYEQKLSSLLDVDVTATLLLARLVGQRMKERYDASGTAGAIVNVGWDQAAHGMGGDSGELFATTKGAVMAMTRSLAQSLAPAVRVNCVAPGWIRTAWGNRASADWDRLARHQALLQRWGTPDDVARVVVFLAGHRAAFVNGQVIPINGGFNYSSPR